MKLAVLSSDVLSSEPVVMMNADDCLKLGVGPDDRVRIAGTSGVIEVRDGHIILIDAAGQRTIEPDAPDRKIFSDFVFGLEGKCECLVDTRQSLDLPRACLLTRQAADDGTIIRF